MWPGVTGGPKEQGTDTIGSEKRKVGYRDAPSQRKENIESIIEQGRPFDLSEVKCACEDLTNLMNVFSDRRTIKICRGRRRLIPKKKEKRSWKACYMFWSFGSSQEQNVSDVRTYWHTDKVIYKETSNRELLPSKRPFRQIKRPLILTQIQKLLEI